MIVIYEHLLSWLSMLNLEVDLLINDLHNFNSVIKIILFLINWGIFWLPIVLPILWFARRQKSAPNPKTHKLTLIISLYSVAPILVWRVIAVEKISWSEIGVTHQASFFQSILFGYALSIGSLLLVYGVQSGLGWLKWQNLPKFDRHFAFTFLSLIIVSFIIGSIEEIVFRGVIAHFLLVDYSIWITAIVSSAIFALLHLIWEQKNTIPQLPGLWLMGLVLFYSYIINGTLGLAIGLHSGWVLILACVDTFELNEYNPQWAGWLIGKKEQPLGSVMGLMVLLLTFLSLWFTIDYQW